MGFEDYNKFLIKTITPEGNMLDTNILVDIDTIYLSNSKDNAVCREPFSFHVKTREETRDYKKGYLELCFMAKAFNDSFHSTLSINEYKGYIKMKFQRLNTTHQKPYISTDNYYKYEPTWKPEDENPTC